MLENIVLSTRNFTRRNLGFFHYPNPYVFSEMGQNSRICNLYGFGKKWLVDEDIFSEMFFSCFGYWHFALGNF